MKKVAVVVFNLGGPDSKNAVRPFLMNFFMDKNIIRLPVPFRCLLAWLISFRRSKREAKESYDELGGSSPLLVNTRAQSDALQEVLSKEKDREYKTFVCMRYWHPMAPQVVREVREWQPDEIVILPLYPQFSTSTTWSSLGDWNKAMFYAGYSCPTSVICCYPFNKGFIDASAESVREVYDQAKKDGHEKIRVLFSAHGLPESFIKQGDPYQWQCEKTAEMIAEKLSIKDLDWSICYQSRVGPKKWIGPSTEEELERAVRDKVAVVIYPHAFTQEHVETLVELDVEYKEVAEHMGIPGYYRARTVSVRERFIDGLAELVKAHVDKNGVYAEGYEKLCPEGFAHCCMKRSAELPYQNLDKKAA